ncbi:lysosomal alpha-mannosidase-like [Bacillus rossius redtenbacheri]|uniref:lysosomal alpha-mannosidase-like n=1 Tax=Bacillus rossius redtenbacheri TaxID=93214 RepID=UPI002FDD74E1
MHRVIVLVAAATTLCAPVPSEDFDGPRRTSCGYAACNQSIPGMVNVHLIPHSHDDVGYRKTVDQYYYGIVTNNTAKGGVQYIIDTVASEVAKDPKKRFVQVETEFLRRWWKEQGDDARRLYRRLVDEGQIEIIGGGAVMNDEADTHYQSTIDQFSLGLRLLDEMLGECGRPRIGWQIDPFGHSKETASIMAQMGFDALFFARLDYQDKQRRKDMQTMEMVWRANKNLGSSADLFTSILYNHYNFAPGFCNDITCSEDPFIDNKRSPDYNVDEKVSKFLEFINEVAEAYTTDHIMLTMGQDFTYQSAHMNYKNMDKLIKYVNALQQNHSNINVFYSTPSCYVKALHDANRTWTTKSDDFFPYGSDPHSYWTGYHTSRPTDKRYERVGNNFLQACKQLSVLSGTSEEESKRGLDYLRDAMAILQHHDAITGTDTQNVADDYMRMLSQGMDQCGSVISSAINKLLSEQSGTGASLALESCPLLNISQCRTSERSPQFLVSVYNPLARPASLYVRLPVAGRSYVVMDHAGTTVPSQLVPVPQSVLDLPYRNSSANQELVFRAAHIPPLSLRSYKVSSAQSTSQGHSVASSDHTITNGNVTVELNMDSGIVEKIYMNNIDLHLSQSMLHYNAFLGNDAESANTSSGAYIFRPTEAGVQKITDKVNVTIYKGDLIQEIHQVFNSWVSQVIRIYKEENFIEFEWMVGPIPVDDGVGKEVISRFTTDLDSKGVFYTDANGREMQKRQRNSRPTWAWNISEPVAGNYYPVTSRIAIRDEARGLELIVLNDRSQGGSSLRDGQVELMVHRRVLKLQHYAEALNETAFGAGVVARGRHVVVVGNTATRGRLLSNQLLLAPLVFLSPGDGNPVQVKGLKNSLPENVHLLTLEPWRNGTILLRVEHVMEKDEDSEMSQNVTVDLKEMLAPMAVRSLYETTLDGNQKLSSMERLEWRTADSARPHLGHGANNFSVSLSPMQIRTFVVTADHGTFPPTAPASGGHSTFLGNCSLLLFCLCAALILNVAKLV